MVSLLFWLKRILESSGWQFISGNVTWSLSESNKKAILRPRSSWDVFFFKIAGIVVKWSQDLEKLFTNMGEWPIDLRSIMFGQCGIKKNVFNRCCNKMETHICNTHKAGGVTPPIWSTLFGQCHYASLYLHGATFYNNTASKYKLSESNTRIISGVGDNATNMRLGSLKAIHTNVRMDYQPPTHNASLTMLLKN